MGLFSRTGDTIYAFRFLRLLTTPWKKLGAYKLGIIDDHGVVLRKPETSEEKSVYNVFHKLVFNVKRMLNKLPFGKTTIASYLAALYLIKETFKTSDDIILEYFDYPINDILNESVVTDVSCGEYKLKYDHAFIETGDMLALKNSIIIVENDIPVGRIFNQPVYRALHKQTNQTIYITAHSI